ncbi:hypothetical protein SDC9_138174 [bioreactor metagenome]|uniref:Uncharacterized protein n=1 Tax=bioreactor metagenome TaxID=1076179 RepID=A0A645DPA7_9ZZZZ
MQENSQYQADPDADRGQNKGFTVNVAVRFSIGKAQYLQSGDFARSLADIDGSQIEENNKSQKRSDHNNQNDNAVQAFVAVQNFLHDVARKNHIQDQPAVDQMLRQSIIVRAMIGNDSVIGYGFSKNLTVKSAAHINIIRGIVFRHTGNRQAIFVIIGVFDGNGVPFARLQNI